MLLDNLDVKTKFKTKQKTWRKVSLNWNVIHIPLKITYLLGVPSLILAGTNLTCTLMEWSNIEINLIMDLVHPTCSTGVDPNSSQLQSVWIYHLTYQKAKMWVGSNIKVACYMKNLNHDKRLNFLTLSNRLYFYIFIPHNIIRA